MTVHVSDKPRSLELGRPRSFSDEQAFAAITAIVQRVGYPGLTLANTAKAIGCTGQALNARFGSRKGMLLAYADWVLKRDLDQFDRSREVTNSPLAALRARFVRPQSGEELAASTYQIRLSGLLIESQNDPEFVDRVRRRIGNFEEQLTSMIEQAVAAGELIVGEPATLAHMMVLMTMGGSVLGQIMSEDRAVEDISRIVELALAPHLPQIHH